MNRPLEDIAIIRQHHPGLSPETPLEIREDAYPRRSSAFIGDVHRVLQLTVVLSGAMEVVFGDGDIRRCRPGDMWWVDSGEPHAYRPVVDRTDMLTINILPESLGNCGSAATDDFGELFRVVPLWRYTPGDGGERRRLLERVRKWRCWRRRREAAWEGRIWLELHAFFLEALGRLRARGLNSARTREYGRIKPALELLAAAEGRGAAPGQAAAAAACALSVGRFAAHFRGTMGMAYGQYALRRRLSAAARDVAAGKLALKDIARRHGFYDASSFNNAFKRLYRCTPGKFKPANRQAEIKP